MKPFPATKAGQRLVAVSASLVVGMALMGIKFYAYWLTSSSAILSDGLESIINVVASGFALWSIVLAAKPPDPNHPYGHGKIEYFSAGFEGALIILAALGIFLQAVPRLLQPQELPNLSQGLFLILLTSAANTLLGLLLLHVGRRTRSLTLVADGKHVLTDVYTSLGVLLGLFLVRMTGWTRLDGGVACVLAVNILCTGGKLVRESFAGLMNETDSELLAEITGILGRHRKAHWIDIHKLRAWRSGNRVHLDFHLILPRDMPLNQGHHEVKELEKLFEDHFDGLADVLIHLDPCTNGECPICSHGPCILREHPITHQRLWHRDAVTADEDGASRHILGDGCKL
jgi:cation diffusion facilitator family transporter